MHCYREISFKWFPSHITSHGQAFVKRELPVMFLLCMSLIWVCLTFKEHLYSHLFECESYLIAYDNAV
jgi:hypothetical protein